MLFSFVLGCGVTEFRFHATAVAGLAGAFDPVVDAAHREVVAIEGLGGHAPGALRAELIARGGAYAQCLAPGRPVRVAVNQVMAQEHTVLSADCEVGFFPPVTGG